jgi:hypothetical protein
VAVAAAETVAVTAEAVAAATVAGIVVVTAEAVAAATVAATVGAAVVTATSELVRTTDRSPANQRGSFVVIP